MPRQRVKPTEPKVKRPRSGITPAALALLDKVIEARCTYTTMWGREVRATRDEALTMLCEQVLARLVPATASGQAQAGPPASEPPPGAQEPGNEAPKGQEKAAEWGPLSFHPRTQTTSP